MFHVKHLCRLFAGKSFLRWRDLWEILHPCARARVVRRPEVGRYQLFSTGLRNSRILRVGVEFEWDEEKDAENLRKHGVSFPQAELAFRDPLSVESFDDRRDYGEDRFIHIATSEGQILTVAYTEREGDRLRIISAGRATKDEQEYYYSQNRI